MKQRRIKTLALEGVLIGVFAFLICTLPARGAQSAADGFSAATAAAIKLVQFGADAKMPFDLQSAGVVVDYVLSAKNSKEAALPSLNKMPGAYYEFDTRIGFASFMQYAYNGQIPAALTSPSSLRFSIWNGQGGKYPKLPTKWAPVEPEGKPLIIRGVQRDAITPDLNTGIYYEYDLNRALIHFNHKGRQVLITISKQVKVSDVGKKGVILGNDEDWNYYYSGEPGSTRTGLSWVKSYIYDYSSVAVYIETAGASAGIRAGIFQWIRAGWNGINFVQTEHIIRGIQRYAKNSKIILESPQLPAPGHLESAYHRLSALAQTDLLEKYTALQQARLDHAARTGKVHAGSIKKDTFAGTPKEQMVEELMLEYLKVALGKPSAIGKQVASAVN
jgi:hypothetical protein